jgi:hypothetical protein
MVPPMEFLFTLGTPKEARKTGQSVTLAKVSLAKLSLRPGPKCLSGQSVSGQSVTGQIVTLAKVAFWTKCPGQSVILAKL